MGQELDGKCRSPGFERSGIIADAINRPSVLGDDSVAHKEPQACSLSLRLGREKRLEDVVQMLRLDADAIIFDADDRLPSGPFKRRADPQFSPEGMAAVELLIRFMNTC